MKKLLPALILLLVLPAASVRARLGETPEQCTKRYGDPVNEAKFGSMQVRTFSKAGFSVTAYFVLKRDMVFAHTRAVAIRYRRSGTTDASNQPLSEKAITKFLDVNALGEDWQEINLLKLAAEATSADNQGQLIRDAHEFRLWTRKSGAKARYMKQAHELIIRASDEVRLPKNKPPDDLDGF